MPPTSSPTTDITPQKTTPINELAEPVLTELDHFGRGFRVNASTHNVSISQYQLAGEPFIAYLKAQHNGVDVQMFICRNETPHGFSASREGILYVSYKSPAGALAAAPLGSNHQVVVHSRSMLRPVINQYIAYAKDEFRPSKQAGVWDATDNRMAWHTGATAYLPSLRKRQETQPGARRVAVKVELPDQAILDQTQDAVFRKPLNRTTVIDGAPGTGKTSVLIKRLAQKTRWEFLDEGERQLFNKDEWDAATQRGANWYLFTPSELLRHYLKEALSRESLPASNETVKAWDTFKRTLLRDSRFLKVGNAGVFQPSASTLLKRPKSGESAALATAFERTLPDFVDDFFRGEIRKFADSSRLVVSDLREQQAAIFEKALYASGAESTSQADTQSLASLARRLNEIARAADLIADRARETKTDKSLITMAAANSIRDQALRAISDSQKVAGNTPLFPRVEPLAEQLTRLLQAMSEALTFARIFDRMPHFYQEFRQQPTIANRFFAEGAEPLLKDRRVDTQELDVLLFVALKATIEAFDGGFAPKHDHGANVLLAARRSVVAVDEATDFSVLELACMRLLSRSGALTVCGDLMQRLTSNGILKWEELDDLVPGWERVTLAVSYRQTERLLGVCRDLYRQFVGEEPPFRSAYQHLETDPAPLYFKSSLSHPSEQWVAERVVEIYEINRGKLPAVGILVPKVEDVRKVASSLQTILQDHNIEIEACEDGNVLGDSERVRVFAVEHIKGLEFESAFFVDVDEMAEAAPDLVARYLYVGLSRARSFLGITFSTQFPRRLLPIKGHFSDRTTFSSPSP